MYLFVWVYVCIMGVCMYLQLRIPIRPGMGNHSRHTSERGLLLSSRVWGKNCINCCLRVMISLKWWFLQDTFHINLNGWVFFLLRLCNSDSFWSSLEWCFFSFLVNSSITPSCNLLLCLQITRVRSNVSQGNIADRSYLFLIVICQL